MQGPDLHRFVSRSNELRRTYEKLMKNLRKSYDELKILCKSGPRLRGFARACRISTYASTSKSKVASVLFLLL